MKMARAELVAVLLHLLIIHFAHGDDSSISHTSENSNSAVLITDEWHQNDCFTRNCLFGKYYETSKANVSNAGNKLHQIHLAVLLPSKPVDEMSERTTQILATTLPVIELAIQAVKEKKILNGYELVIHHRDTQCSSTIGPMAAFDLYNRQEADVFLGPICDYVLAPVARYASVWQLPVLSTGGIAAAFNNKVKAFQLGHPRISLPSLYQGQSLHVSVVADTELNVSIDYHLAVGVHQMSLSTFSFRNARVKIRKKM